jgi:hypothetical protein
MKCDKCDREIQGVYYRLEVGDAVAFSQNYFCCRTHLIEHVAPELKQAVVVNQWVPTTQDEIDRMSQ